MLPDFHELFIYKDGKLFYKNKFNNKEVGFVDKHDGRLRVNINYRYYQLGRIIFIMHYGAIPTGYVIDYRDGNKQNLRIENLVLRKKSDLPLCPCES